MSDLDALLSTVPGQVLSFAEISRLAREGKYPEALEKLSASSLNESTKQQLQKALGSGEKYVVGNTLEELERRIAQAMCWDCWRD